MAGRGDITSLIAAARGGDAGAADRLAVLIYDELRVLARRCLRDRAAANTLSTTALVHEAYLRIGGDSASAFPDRAHFFAYAAQVMRRILVDQARRAYAGKRGGHAVHVGLDDVALPLTAPPEQIVALDQALDRLQALDERLARIVEMRVFAGLEVDEAAEVLGLSERTVKRDWRKARALLGAWLAEPEQN
jgi:RNA polymerase sigma factor (TIGR02999 family)